MREAPCTSPKRTPNDQEAQFFRSGVLYQSRNVPFILRRIFSGARTESSFQRVKGSAIVKISLSARCLTRSGVESRTRRWLGTDVFISRLPRIATRLALSKRLNFTEVLPASWRIYRSGTLLTASDKLSFIEKIECSPGLALLHRLSDRGKIHLCISSRCRPKPVPIGNFITHSRQQITIRQRLQGSEFPVG